MTAAEKVDFFTKHLEDLDKKIAETEQELHNLLKQHHNASRDLFHAQFEHRNPGK
ncbi:MAG: hypothetical protein ACREBJ_08930 [Nitrosotalea sp.]